MFLKDDDIVLEKAFGIPQGVTDDYHIKGRKTRVPTRKGGRGRPQKGNNV